MKKTKVHFGCGYHRLAGWINVDLDRSSQVDVIADLRQGLPFKSGSIDYIHSEDFVDQLALEQALGFFRECYRILKENGTMRVLTPNLYQFAKRYVAGDRGLLKLWDEQVGLPLKIRTLAEVFNLGMRLGGHTFLYDAETLVHVLEGVGFEPRKVSYNSSRESELRGLDIRSPRTGVSLYYECYKKETTQAHSTKWIGRILKRRGGKT